MKEGFELPTDIIFQTRVHDPYSEESNPYKWMQVDSSSYFYGLRSVVFSLPGAFTPTCSNQQLPDFETLHRDITAEGVTNVYCVSVNDAFVMNRWKKELGIKKVIMIPDGNGEFTKAMGMLVDKSHLGFGMRSWRYAAVIDDGVVEKWWQEPGINNDGSDDDPYTETTPVNVINYLKECNSPSS